MTQTLNEIYQLTYAILAIIGALCIVFFLIILYVANREAKQFDNDPRTLNPDDQYTIDRMNQNEYQS